MKVRSWKKTDVGRMRDHNEDSLFADDDIMLYVVADGMGGHIAGETASKTAVSVIEEHVRGVLFDVPEKKSTGTMIMNSAEASIEEILIDAVQKASGAILDHVDSNPSHKGMGTTTTLLFFHSDSGWFAHVGDSRLYRFRDNSLLKITTDHSLVQEQMDAGLITKEQAAISRFKNIITRSVGFERIFDVDCETLDIEQGDIFLICSDGLTNLVTDRELGEILANKSPEDAIKLLVNLANSRGGDDNITIIIVQIESV